MKRSELFFSGIQVPIDFLAIALAATTAYWIRNIPEVIIFNNRLYEFSYGDYINVVLLIIPFLLGIFAFEGLYSIRITRSFISEIGRVFRALSIGLVIVIVMIFLQNEWFASRFIILATWILATFYVVIFRFILLFIQRQLLLRRGIGVHRVLLINGSEKTKFFSRVLGSIPKLGYRVVDIVEGINLRQIKDVRKKMGIDEIILCDPSVPDDLQEKLIDYCSIHNIGYLYVPTSIQASKIRLRTFEGEPVFEVTHTPLDGWGKILKRIFDIVASSLLILLSFPIMMIIAILIKLEDPDGPIVFKNDRVGADGKIFRLFKFRYMKWRYSTSVENPHYEEALAYEKELIKKRNTRKGPIYKIKDDPRKTRIGKIIERLSLDELPQFFNVWLGSMSLVGPRPHQNREVEKYREYHRRLLTIKPGITGMAQVSGRSDLDFEDEFRLDLFYIENWSLSLDILLCLRTIKVLATRRKNS
ncbi:MAG: sugar transferase [Candidatus Moraniibacteriota bacterium]|nr:MAG: sugar transferase [Candidatus Moranbacteria bacterium]